MNAAEKTATPVMAILLLSARMPRARRQAQVAGCQSAGAGRIDMRKERPAEADGLLLAPENLAVARLGKDASATFF